MRRFRSFKMLSKSKWRLMAVIRLLTLRKILFLKILNLKARSLRRKSCLIRFLNLKTWRYAINF